MYGDLKTQLQAELDEIRAAGLYKGERVIDTPQAARVSVGERSVLNMCANNYLGLASHPEVIEAARDALDEWGYGLASVRFICGTQAIHKQLEDKLSDFLGMEDTILYTSCFDANGGLFETLLGPNDAVISDELNHASIIDGVRLCKAKRFRYKNNDMADLATQLEAAKGARRILIVTDGVFSMDGYLANLPDPIDRRDFGFFPRDAILVLCTGSQGDYRAGMTTLAEDKRSDVYLEPGDTALFSARRIPGCELSVDRVQHLLRERGIRVVDERDGHVHVSGHPRREELRALYTRVAPLSVIPVHGTPRHLDAHAALAREMGLETSNIRNGDVLRIGTTCEVVGQVPVGREERNEQR